MGVENFIKTMWQSELIEEFRGQSLIHEITYAVPTEGGKLIINKMGAVAVKDYEGNVEYDELNTTKVEVPFDQTRYFAIKIHDVEACQLAGDIRQPAIREGGYRLAKAVDDHAVEKIMESGANAKVVALTKSNAYEEIVNANRNLDKKDVPNDRVIVCGWDVVAMLEAGAMKDNFHQDVVANGMEYRLNGVRVVPTNRVADGTVIILSKQAVAMGMQLNELEALRLESSFSDAIRGLEQFAVAVVREEAIEIIKSK